MWQVNASVALYGKSFVCFSSFLNKIVDVGVVRALGSIQCVFKVEKPHIFYFGFS